MECRHWWYVIHREIIPYVGKSNSGPNWPLQLDGVSLACVVCFMKLTSIVLAKFQFLHNFQVYFFVSRRFILESVFYTYLYFTFIPFLDVSLF